MTIDAKHSTQSPLYNVSQSSLDMFVKDELEPDTEYNDNCCTVVDRLCNFMKNNFPAKLRPAQIIKGGSLGKGTAVKGKSDVDLVVFLPFDSIQLLQNDMDTVLDDMKTSCMSGNVPLRESTGNRRLPTSYPLEVITISQWLRECRLENFDLRKGFYNVLKALVNYRKLAYVCEDNYSSSDVKKSLKQIWHVMDPANPFNNLMRRFNCWKEVKTIATISLNKPLLNDLSGDVGWI
ncbi:OAS [Mytilus coruscus]|uniref:OAS n=1 Tax=Mytilus coruscus TaxID=42192 RepID=A0A6J8DNB9_MYTCO|nr:OAS [Mytilus coruscus]